MTSLPLIPGQKARLRKGWWGANKWLVLRRASQTLFLALFAIGPVSLWLLGKEKAFWPVKGTLASSMTLDFLPLSDPLIVLQSLLAGHLPDQLALIGAGIVLVCYVILGGRTYCSWVCPINPITDLAYRLRSRLDIRGGAQFSGKARGWFLVMILGVAAISGTIAWEMINPITLLHRGLFFGIGMGWTVIIAVFLFDLFFARRGWCGHLCPVGAFYGLLGKAAQIRISTANRKACDNCLDCYSVCPEPQVISPALKPQASSPKGQAVPMIMNEFCTNCGRCIDVCHVDVFRFDLRFNAQDKDGNDEKTSQRRAA